MEELKVKKNDYFERLTKSSEAVGFIIHEPSITDAAMKVVFNPETEEELNCANNLLTFFSDICVVYADTINGVTPVDYRNNSCIDFCVDIINAIKSNTDAELLEKARNEVNPAVIAKFIFDKYRAFTADSDLAIGVITDRCGYNPYTSAALNLRPYLYDAEFFTNELLDIYFNVVQAMDTEEERALSENVVNEFHRLCEQNRQRS